VALTAAPALAQPATARRVCFVPFVEQPGHTPEILAACGDKHVILGLLDLGRPEPETVDHIAARLSAALAAVPAARLHPSSDCGLWHLPRAAAYAKIAALADATRRARAARG
jgi:5-methyltetrahydropteroyltriglutamate--homocysteine methyltransferase